ncbi:MAG: hypothetical protein NTX87_08240 [Planctomycetota bacterium]|nr:hypothetical protein [Planctomycetota bacterium]
MSYLSVDQLQKMLTQEVFHYAQDRKKAAGRALGTLVEVITFYTLKSWGFEQYIAIERALPEYRNPDITHNVEYSLHPSTRVAEVRFSMNDLPITTRKLARKASECAGTLRGLKARSSQLLSRDLVLRNSCIIGEVAGGFVVACLEGIRGDDLTVGICILGQNPFAIAECKRVGLEEGTRKGPQTIEKAKQGAYVARTVSALQRIRLNNGTVGGVIHLPSGELYSGGYEAMLREVISSERKDLLQGFVLTVGVVSNHGNWFTSDNHNKELKVLSQSYDWLLFLTDAGLAEFVSDLLLKPLGKYLPIRKAFLASYSGKKAGNQFTKVQMALDADTALRDFFRSNQKRIESWFNVISPNRESLVSLRRAIADLAGKNWAEILK